MRLASALAAVVLAAGLAAGSGGADASTRVIVVLKTPSLGQRVAAHGGAATIEQERAWTRAALAAQQRLLARLARRGVVIRPLQRFARVLDGFAAVVPPGIAPVLEQDANVVGVYPVRSAYPAGVSVQSRAVPGSEIASPLASGDVDGRGVTVAVLDTAGEHAREMAAIVARVAPGASLMRVRLAAPATSDGIVAGLERAVDPNGDGDAHDAARIALVPLAEPFASFPDSPEARAVAGARALDLLVVAPVGNDGAAGPVYGDVAGPGGSPDALTVGALDTLPSLANARVVVRTGLRTLFDATVPLGGTTPPRALGLRVAAPASLFTARGGSMVAGRAALIGPHFTAAQAAAAGASAVLLGAVAARAAGDVRVPVLSLPLRVARDVRRRIAAGAHVTVVLGPAAATANPRLGRVAPFSSTGLAFDGRLKPDVVAPGVDVPAGRVRVNGSSAAAAVVAGAAALLAQARPGLDARTLDGLIVATAHPLPHEPVTAQGAGVLDIGAAAAGEIAVAGETLTNVSVRTIRIRQGTLRPGEHVAVRGPAVVTVPGGGTVRVAAPPVPVQPVDLIAGASISRNGRLLTVAAGRVERVHGGIELRPVARLDVVLGRLGLVARVRDALPGRYTFGLNGPPGSYAVTVLAYPVGGGPPSRRTLEVTRR